MSFSEDVAEFGEKDITVRVVRGLLGILPFAPDWSPPLSLEQAAARRWPEHAGRVAARVEQLAREPGPAAALRAFAFLDKGDTGIAIFSGVRGAVKAARGQEGALELDPQQAADAGLKAVGLCYVTWKLFPGSPQDRARRLTETEAGRALLAWYVAADLVLPFTDNLAAGGVDLFTEVVDRFAAPSAERLAAVAGPEAAEAAGMLPQLAGTLRSTLGQAAAFATPLSAWAEQTLPGVLSTADKVSGVAATGADVLPTYRCLGTSLVLEVVLAQALEQVRAEVAAEEAAAAEARRKAEEEEARRKAEAEEARRKAEEEARRQAAEAEARAKAEAEARRRAAEEAERARIAEEDARREQSKQREEYTLDDAVEAASLRNAPIKVTRTAEIAPAQAALPEKKGCLGCGAMVLIAVVAGGAAALLPFV